jgi:hypothetical protein
MVDAQTAEQEGAEQCMATRSYLRPGEIIDPTLAPNAQGGNGEPGWPAVWLMARGGGYGPGDAFYCPRSGQPVPPGHYWCTPCLGIKGGLAFNGLITEFGNFRECRVLVTTKAR